MATQQYGYGINAWGGATPLGAVKIPTLSQPGGAAPQFKPRNPLATAAAKMVGEMAYGQMQEAAAPKYIGVDEITQRPIFEKQRNSEKYEPEDGWKLPQGGAYTSDLPILHKELEIANTKTNNVFENNRLMTDAALTEQAKLAGKTAPSDSALYGYDGIGLASRGVDMDGFEPTIVPPADKTKVIDNPQREEFVPKDPSYVQEWSGGNEELATYIDRLDAATTGVLERYKEEKTFMGIGNLFKKESDRIAHINDTEFLDWALQAGDSINLASGAGAHFLKDGMVDYNLLAQYESNPFQYWLTNIKGKE